MKVECMDNMIKGWFIGNFTPTLYKTNDCEVAVKKYKKGDFEKAHFHKIATEITVIVNGRVKMFDREFGEGEVIIVEPGDITSFEALEDSTNVVVKLPGANDDKYEVEDEKC